MLRLTKPNWLEFISPVDPRTVVLFLACVLAFFMGMRFEQVSTLRMEQEFTEYKLAQAKELEKAQQEVLLEAVAAQSAIQEIQENALVREKELTAHSDRLSARLDAERVRRQTLATQLAKARAAGTASDSDAAPPEPDLYGETGKNLISLTEDADRVLSGFRDCQAYVKVLRKACE